MKAIDVSPVEQSRLKESLTYFSKTDYKIGDFVSITIRNKKVLGVVEKSTDVSGEKSTLKKSRFVLKKIQSAIGETFLSDALVNSARILAQYYGTTTGITLSTLAPVHLFKKEILECPAIQKNKGFLADAHSLELPEEERIIFYKKIIRESFARKESILIVTPTHDLANFFSAALSKGIGEYTFVHTSDSTKPQINKLIEALRADTHPLCIIGTPASLFLPIQKLGLIVVENEQTNAYEQVRFPFFDGRVVAEAVARGRNVPIVFADTFLRTETLQKFSSHPMQRSIARRDNTHLDILDRNTPSDRRSDTNALSKEAYTKIENTLSKNGRVFIFAFRKGYAGTTVCRDCGAGIRCPECDRPLVLHGTTEKKKFRCGLCKKDISPDLHCARCSSWNILPLGIGIDKVAEELREKIGATSLFLIDGDTKAKESKKQMADFVEKGGVLVGNEAALSRLHIHIDEAIIASLDSLLGVPSYTATERIGNIVSKIAEKSSGGVLLQTRYPLELIFSALKSGNWSEFRKKELEDRSALKYPPFATLLSITLQGAPNGVQKWTEHIEKELAQFSPFISKTNIAGGKISATIVTKLPTLIWSIQALFSPIEETDKIATLLQTLPHQALIKIN